MESLIKNTWIFSKQLQVPLATIWDVNPSKAMMMNGYILRFRRNKLIKGTNDLIIFISNIKTAHNV